MSATPEPVRPATPSTSASDTGEFVALDRQAGRYYEIEPRVAVEVEVGAVSDRGKVRENNEDHYLAVRRVRHREVIKTSLPVELLPQDDQAMYTLAVADGMGGHAFGELASYLALRTGWDLGEGEVKWSVKMNEKEAAELKDKATVFFKLINRRLHEAARERPRLAGMGTTLTVCYSTGPEVFVTHAGDSRAYLHRAGGLTRLTKDHTVAQVLIDAGVVSPGSPEANRAKHALTNCVGGPDAGIDVDVRHYRLQDGDRLLLCTDGLTDLVSDPEIAQALTDVPNPDDACRVLVDLALLRGGKDNVTVVVAKYAFAKVDENAIPRS